MEARPHSLPRLLLGLTIRVSAGRGMADSHHEVHGSYDPEEKRVGRPQRADSTPVHALCGPPLPRGHKEGSPGPRQVHRMDRLRWLLPLETGPAGTGSSRPSPPG